MKIEVEADYLGQSKLIIIGDVRHVLEGNVEAKSLHETIHCKFRYALGGATFFSEKELGESLIYQDLGYVSYVDENDRLKMVNNFTNFKAAFLMGLDETAMPHVKIFVQNQDRKTFDQLYAQILEKFPNGFAIAGKGIFLTIDSAYLKKPPIYHENINKNKDEYWQKEQLTHTSCAIFGVVLKKDCGYPGLDRAFYSNPNEKEEYPFLSHTHIGVFSEKVKFNKESQGIDSVRHFFNTSIIEQGRFLVFGLNRFDH